MRTSITTADGTSFRAEGATRRLFRKGVIIALTIAGLIFIAAAVIGFTKAATAPADHSPSRASLTALHKATAQGAKNCRLEWNAKQDDHEVICDPAQGTANYNDGWVDATKQLTDLYARAPRTTTQPDGSIITDPRGSDLITECLDDATLTTDEVMACLAQ